MKEVGYCQTCKWWERGRPSSKTGVCHAVEEWDMYTSFSRPPSEEPDSFTLNSDEGATLITGPHFGCIHHEGQEETKE